VVYENRHAGKDFLILCNGPSIQEYAPDISTFIKKYQPIVMGANYIGGLFKPAYHAFSNKKRFANYVDSVDPDASLLVSSSFSEKFIAEHTQRKYEIMVHLNKVSSHFQIVDGVINSNCRTVGILLIAVAIVMGARRIFIAGMDGYKSKDNYLARKTHFYDEPGEAADFRLLAEKHDYNEAILVSINEFLAGANKEGLHILTPTSHGRFYNSIYNWIENDDSI